ncbi:MAG: peptidoglycan D,D-transpeptidase FtsI family protein [Lachnospiraceae bacterium]
MKKAFNKQYAIISYFFVFIFVSLIGYLAYFSIFVSGTIIDSPYNKRIDSLAETIVRGNIESADGQVLAHTNTDESGTETRVYDYGDVFAHAVGYSTQGTTGLESLANYELLHSSAFIGERIVNDLRDEKNTGDTVVTSLDTRLQQAAYQALGDNRGAILVMNPSIGEILAMVSKPDFDPNSLDADWETLSTDEEQSSLLNRATQGLYPPGSTFKIVTALTYLRTGHSVEDFSYYCEGSITKADSTVSCAGGSVHGQEDLAAAFANSCNCAFVEMGVSEGATALRTVSEELLFNSALDYELPYSKSSVTVDENSGVPLLMRTAIGQGETLATPLQMALITSAIANDGLLMKPTLISEIKDHNGNSIEKTEAAAYTNLMTAQEAQILTTLMEGVVTNGTATDLSGRGYTSAGKTGTAEYGTDGQSHSWFVGFSNVEDPDIVVSIVVENGGDGNASAVPMAAEIFDTYYNSVKTAQ